MLYPAAQWMHLGKYLPGKNSGRDQQSGLMFDLDVVRYDGEPGIYTVRT